MLMIALMFWIATCRKGMQYMKSKANHVITYTKQTHSLHGVCCLYVSLKEMS